MKSLMAKFWTRLRAKQTPLTLMIIGLDNSGKTSILNSVASSHRDNLALVNFERLSSQPAGDELLPVNESSELMVATKFDKNDEFRNVLPTAGYTYERIQYKSSKITVLDFSGQNRYRNLWQEFYDSVDGIVFVIDSSDLIRLVVVRDELELLLNHRYFASLACIDQRITPIIQKQVKIRHGGLIQSPLKIAASDELHGTPVENQNENQMIMGKSSGCSGLRTRVPILFLANKTDLPNSIDTEVIVNALNLNRLPESRHPWSIQATSVTLNQGIVEGFDCLINQLT